jgi:phosphatidate cytidylyltransferase
VNDKNKNLLVRIVSALVLLPLVVFLLVQGGFACAALIAFVAGACASEYYGITLKKLTPITWVGVGFAAALPLLPAWQPERAAGFALWAVLFYFVLSWAHALWKGDITEGPIRVAHGTAGLVYAGVGLFALSALRSGESGLQWVFCALVVTWVNDTSAYFSGRFLGKHKLYPAVSPNKTWEGFFGGMVGSIGGLFLSRLLFPQLTALDCVLLGIAGGVLGPMGDLCESLLKRAYGVKDSGKIIPGHGGLLDRVDALIFNAPMVLAYAHWLRGLW